MASFNQCRGKSQKSRIPLRLTQTKVTLFSMISNNNQEKGHINFSCEDRQTLVMFRIHAAYAEYDTEYLQHLQPFNLYCRCLQCFAFHWVFSVSLRLQRATFTDQLIGHRHYINPTKQQHANISRRTGPFMSHLDNAISCTLCWKILTPAFYVRELDNI